MFFRAAHDHWQFRGAEALPDFSKRSCPPFFKRAKIGLVHELDKTMNFLFKDAICLRA
jgi:hypothetical protein